MTLAHQRAEWDRTALIVTTLHNVNCAKKGDRISDPSTFNPYREKPKREKMSLKEIRKAMGA